MENVHSKFYIHIIYYTIIYTHMIIYRYVYTYIVQGYFSIECASVAEPGLGALGNTRVTSRSPLPHF